MSRLELDPVIHQATRLRLMTALARNRDASWVSLRNGLGLTDGNLGSHAEKLIAAGYVESRRALTPAGFEVRLRITPKGALAFQAYARELRALLDDGPAEAGARDTRRSPTPAAEGHP